MKQIRPPIASNRYLQQFSPDIIKRNRIPGFDRGNMNPYIPSAQLSGVEPGDTQQYPEYKFSGQSINISRSLLGQTITIDTTPVLILQPPHPTPYIISNPSLLIGLTDSSTVYSGTTAGAGNTQATPIGVANYMTAHFHLDVTAVTGTWDIYAQTKDPISGNWADSQVLFGAISATGTTYGNIGSFGLVSDFAIRWIPTAAGSLTFSLGLTVKDGIAGGSAGSSRTIFLGGQNVTIDNGFPLFEGDRLNLDLNENVYIYAVSAISLPIKVFTL